MKTSWALLVTCAKHKYVFQINDLQRSGAWVKSVAKRGVIQD